MSTPVPRPSDLRRPSRTFLAHLLVLCACGATAALSTYNYHRHKQLQQRTIDDNTCRVQFMEGSLDFDCTRYIFCGIPFVVRDDEAVNRINRRQQRR